MEKAIKELYLARAEKRIDSKLRALALATDQRADSNGVVIVRGQLEKLEEAIFETLFRDGQEAFSHLPVKAAFEPGMTSYTYRMETMVGEASVLSNEAEDRPVIDTFLAETTRKVLDLGASYVYTVGDSERASLLDYDHVEAKARAAAEAIARAHNTLALSGNTVNAITGFLNDAAVTPATLVDGDWTTATGAQMADDLNALIVSIPVKSLGAHKATNLALPTAVYSIAASKRIDAVTGDTILDAVRKAHPGLAITMLNAASGVGAAGKDRAVAYEKRSDRLEIVAPVLYDEAAPDKNGFAFKVAARGKSAGCVVRYPLSVAYGDITVA